MVTLEFIENKILIARTLNPGHRLLSDFGKQIFSNPLVSKYIFEKFIKHFYVKEILLFF